MIDTKRKQFEQWYLKEMNKYTDFQFDGDYYYDENIQLAWRGWQAALKVGSEPDAEPIAQTVAQIIESVDIPKYVANLPYTSNNGMSRNEAEWKCIAIGLARRIAGVLK